MKKFKIYGIARELEIVAELRRLGYIMSKGHLSSDEDYDGSILGIAQGTDDSDDEYCKFSEDSDVHKLHNVWPEVTLQQLRDMPTPKKKVKREMWLSLRKSGAFIAYTYEADAIKACKKDHVVGTRHIEWEGEE